LTRHTLSEDEVIRVIRRTVRSRGRVRLGIGDDAAVLADSTVVTTDAYAEGVHFDLSYMTLRQVGERCACGAISDVVAMAAEPEAVLVALSLPRVTSDHFPVSSLLRRRREAPGDRRKAVRRLYSGIESVCREMGCEVAGGDIIIADRLLLALTVTGKTRTPKLRAGARPGDRLYVTGHLGSAEAGRLLLAQQVKGQRSKVKGQDHDWRYLVRRHLRPVPRLAVVRALKSHIHGLIDTSDGLATDARHLSEMSGVRVVLEPGLLPVLPAVWRFCSEHGRDPIGFVLGAGEDYELLFTSSHDMPRAVNGVKVTGIGKVEKGRGLWIEDAGRVLPVTASGYDHFSFDKT